MLLRSGFRNRSNSRLYFDRINIRNADAIRHGRTGGRSAAWSDENAEVAAGLDEIRNDQEVAREAHRLDRKQLEVESLFGFRGDIAITLFRALEVMCRRYSSWSVNPFGN